MFIFYTKNYFTLYPLFQALSREKWKKLCIFPLVNTTSQKNWRIKNIEYRYIFLVVYYNKQKAVPATANNEKEDEE